MNLNTQHAAYWRKHKQKPFSPSESHLFFYLVHLCQNQHWANPFEQSDADTQKGTDMARGTLKTAREKLVAAGLLAYVSRVGRGNVVQYTLIDRLILTITLTIPPVNGSKFDTFTHRYGPDSLVNVSKFDQFVKGTGKVTGLKVSKIDTFKPDTPVNVSNIDPFNGEKVSKTDQLIPVNVSDFDPFTAENFGAGAEFFTDDQTVNELSTEKPSRTHVHEPPPGPIQSINESIVILPEPRVKYNSNSAPVHVHTTPPPFDTKGRVWVHVPSEGLSFMPDELYPHFRLPGYGRAQMAQFALAHDSATFASSAELVNKFRIWMKAQKRPLPAWDRLASVPVKRARFVALVDQYRTGNPDKYESAMYDDFIEYWTEVDPATGVMKRDTEKDFFMGNRLRTMYRLVWINEIARREKTKNQQHGKSPFNNTKSAVNFDLDTELQRAAETGDTINSFLRPEEDD